MDDRSAALDYLACKTGGDRKYVLGRYLFTRAPIWMLPEIDVELPPPAPVLFKDPEGATVDATVVPRYRHRFHAIDLGGGWWGYFHDEGLGWRYAFQRRVVRNERAWWRRWIGYLLGGPRP